MILEGPIWLANSDRYFILHRDGSLQLRQELIDETSILVDSCNYFYQKNDFLKLCQSHFPAMTMIEFGNIQKTLDHQLVAIKGGASDVRLF
ncbi:hypothetical protein DT351_11085 (plasmid) [Latilactobacillus curvatus]|uniref:Uncharacterized protein n=2 Tax=Latilactobacillus curvatus TaxID=28038 RepID=A0A385AH52_LATCU|nr:hypothetical protein [Latilactobacillus curvatus]AXN36884.1 hypothetical protein DT351_11085 [Latilactobacillus curvatus]